MGEEIVKAPATAVATYNPDDPMSLYLQGSVFDQLQRVSKLMANSALVPAHLRGEDKQADCFLVVAQAFRWRLDPFAVAQHTYVLSGKLGYEGKLIAAVINSSSRLAVKLGYEYKGEGQDRAVRVTGTLKGESKPREVIGSVKQWRTERNPKWLDLPDQMLAYRGAREWARRHMPEVILGVFADEEVEQMAITAPARTVTVSSETLDDFMSPSKVVSESDPQGNGGNKKVSEEPVEAEVVEKPKKAAKPQPEKSGADKELSDLFS